MFSDLYKLKAGAANTSAEVPSGMDGTIRVINYNSVTDNVTMPVNNGTTSTAEPGAVIADIPQGATGTSTSSQASSTETIELKPMAAETNSGEDARDAPQTNVSVLPTLEMSINQVDNSALHHLSKRRESLTKRRESLTHRQRFNSKADISFYSRLDGMSNNLAVEVKNAKLTYGSGKKAHHALRGVNLRVPEGVIYGLLGPSGCGKTTLLNTVIGKLSLKNGQVKVFGEQPGTSKSIIPGCGVGFMPQELALYAEFTIEETLTYFGRLHQIDAKVLKERTEFLLNFLDLPTKSRLVANLSGGQQRRVSFAAALIHRPPLLILDEPTVGVDPLLRQSIWNHLVMLTSSEGMTVIITTHYIEEARQANVVGLMRKGRLLAEASPEELMEFFNEPSLEDCFLKLCMLDKETKQAEKELNQILATDGGATPALPGILERRLSKELVPAIIERRISKDLTPSDDKDNPVFIISDNGKNPGGLDTNKANSACTLNNSTLDLINNSVNDLRMPPSDGDIVPSKNNRIVIPKRPNQCMDGLNKTMVLFNKNITRLRRNIAVVLFQYALPAIQVILLCLCIGRNPFDLDIAIVNDEQPPKMSRLFLQKLDNETIIQQPFNNLEDAVQSVRDGNAWAVIHISHNFTKCLIDRFSQGLDVTNETIECSTVKVHLDMTNQQIGLTLQTSLLYSFQKFAQDLLQTIGSTPLLANLPVVMEKPIYGVVEVSFTEFITPGVILSITYIMAVGLTAISFVEERKSGLFDRSWVSGVTAFQVLTSHIMTQFFVLIGQVLGLLVFTFLVFDIPSRGPFIWVILMTLFQGVCGMCFGLLISALVTEENTAVMISLGSFYPNIILSGIVWPVEGMPHFLRYFSYCLPQTLPTEGMRAVLSRGWGIEYSLVWSGFLVTFAWTAFFILAAVAVFRFKK